MLLSIILPVYNTKDYLEKCVDSVLAGDTSDCELLLVDDGSTDGVTPALCDEIAKKHPEIRVIHQENCGLGGARNTGIREAVGEYLFFIDSDDTIVPDALALLKEEIGRSGADIIAFDLFSDDGTSSPVSLSASAYHAREPFTLAEHPEFLQSMPSAWSRIWKRSLFLENGVFFPTQVWFEDLRTSTKLFALARSIVTLDKPLYVYYQREGSIMHSSKTERNREIIDAFDDVLSWFEEKGRKEELYQPLCRLCVEHLYLSASVRVLLQDKKHPLIEEFRAYIRRAFPDYRKTDLSFLPRARRLIFHLLERRLYWVIRLLFRIKG